MNDGSGLQVWGITPVMAGTPTATPLLSSGVYTIGSTARAGCAGNLNSVACAAGNGVDMDAVAGAGP
jgi:hypothetical protein